MLEVRTTGRYSSTEWSRNGVTAGQPLFPVSAQSFADFGEVYVAETTTMGDLGVYEVVLDPAPDSGQRVPSRLRFDVISPGRAYSVFSCNSEFCIALRISDAANTSSGANVVSVSEEGSVDISCTSVGVPVPTVSWTFNNLAAPFDQTDSSTDLSVRILGGGNFELTQGSVVSRLHLVDAQYPADEGVYVCIGANTHAGVTTTSSAMITVQVLGKEAYMLQLN